MTSRAWRPGAMRLAALATLAAIASGCAGPRVVYVDRPAQAYYQTAFPFHDTSRDLERAFRSLRQIVFTATYETYEFAPGARVTERDALDPDVLATAQTRYTDQQSKTGTAVIIARTDRRVALITNDHVVRYPPVRIHFADDDAPRQRRETRRVASVSIRRAELGGLTGHPGAGPLRVLARDSAADLAIVEVRLPELAVPERFPPLTIAPGNPRRLSWGSFVYVLGFPGGHPMATRALVSDPDRDRAGGFLTDGLWNEGISGGVVLAIRGDDGALEWVGMTRAGAGESEVRLQPADPELIDPDLAIRYDGPVYAEPTLRIRYGITYSVPMPTIRAFVHRHGALLRQDGYEVRGF